MPNILITGGAGFIGQHLTKRLCEREGHHIIIIDDLSNAKNNFINSIAGSNDNLSFYREDIKKGISILDILKHHGRRIDTCIHLAAKISVCDSITKPDETIDVNVRGTLNVLEACSYNNVRSFIFASSAAVYGEPKQLPISEDHVLEPLSPYGKSKVVGESLVSLFGISKKIQNVISLRLFNIYGIGQSTEYAGVITRFAKRLCQRLPPVIYGDGHNTRDFVYIDDVINAILLAMNSADKIKSGIFNIGTGMPISLNTLAKMMIRLWDLELQPIYCKPKKGDITHSYADTTNAKNNLKFTATEKFELGLNRLLKQM